MNSFIAPILHFAARRSALPNPAPTYIGHAYQVELADGTKHRIDAHLYIGRHGLYATRGLDPLNVLPVHNPQGLACVWYERDRPEGRYWFHDLDRAVVDVDTFGVASGASHVCPSPPGDYICEGR